jgi:hypothetical protein
MIKQMGFSNHEQNLRKWIVHYALSQIGSDILKSIFEGHGENGCLSWIWIFSQSRITDPGAKRALDPGSGSAVKYCYPG